MLTDSEFDVDAVALSPMRRTIETALLGLPQLEAACTAFGWAHDDDPTKPPPMLATDLLRERCGGLLRLLLELSLQRTLQVADKRLLGECDLRAELRLCSGGRRAKELILQIVGAARDERGEAV